MGIAERQRMLEAEVKPKGPVDWQERLARSKRHFDEREAGVPYPRWDE